MPHFGNNTWASVANRLRIESPVDVTPPLSNAFRYSSATLLRCSSVMVCWAMAIGSPLDGRASVTVPSRPTDGGTRRSRRSTDVPVDPGGERVAVVGDGVPGLVEGVVADASSPSRSSGAHRRAPRTPRRSPTPAARRRRASACSSSTISSTVTIDRSAASTASFCTPTRPQICTLPARSALLGVDDRRRRG